MQRMREMVKKDFQRLRRPDVLAAILVGIASAGAHAAQPLPVGGAFVAGSGSITSGAQSVNIGQTSTRGVITWNSFDIAAGKTVTIDNGTGATLNRVTGGGSASSILGTLNATGSVYLINPQGVVIGTSGVIATGGRFVASALDVANDAFMNGGALTFANGGDGMVVNMGKIGSSNGDVFLIARSTVSNQGTITAPNGTAELAAGSQILLQDSASGQQVFVSAGSGGTVSNAGAINAAQANLQAADGNVYALAGNASAIRATGTATRDGHVWLVADKGHVQIHDSVTAKNADGSGGTVDSSGNTLNIGGSTVTAGQWNLAVPVSYVIDSTTASALSASLNAGTNVDMEATRSDASLSLNGAIDWNSGASLTLGAGRNVGVTKAGSIGNGYSGNLVLRADAGGLDNGGSIVNLGTIDWSGSTGLVSALYDMSGKFTPGTLMSNSRWTPQPYSGEVTQITAYKLVNNVADMENVSANLAANYALGKDFFAGTAGPVAAIGAGGAAPFTGQFDGFDHTISGLQVGRAGNPEGANDGGMFDVIGKSGVVRNLTLTSASMYGNEGTTGILAATNEGTVANVTVSGTSTTCCFGGTTGGLVGINDGLIERSSANASVGGGEAGGLVGVNNGTIAQSFETGATSAGSHGSTGGLVGDNEGLITQSYATGSADGLFGGGGIVNTNGNTGVINESFATGFLGDTDLSGPNAFGGIASGNSGTIHSNVYWDAQLTTRTNAVGNNVAGATAPPDSNGLPTAYMGMPAAFAGWNFGQGGAWAMPAGASHPVLQWQLDKM